MSDQLNQLGVQALMTRGYELTKHVMLGRVSRQDRQRVTVLTEEGPIRAVLNQKNRLSQKNENLIPAVGDWVEIDRTLAESELPSIKALLPRYSKLSRRAAGDAPFEQVLVANPDLVFVVSGLDQNFNPNRIQRFLSMAWSCGLPAVLLLSKADLIDQLPEKLKLLEPILCGTPVYPVNMHSASTLAAPLAHLKSGQCAALIGSSGVGKSTLVNQLLGFDQMITREVRAFDDKGRHTTTHRELCVLPGSGGLIIDTPGMREAQIWYDEAQLQVRYRNLLDLARHCKFTNCRHLEEPDCSVRNQASTDVAMDNLWRQYCLVTHGITDISKLPSKR
ncbi:MAG: ribosome small subunit-dependent GTPase A [Pseudomonadales bacterium]